MKPAFAILATALISGFAPSASGQEWDNTGNNLLNGTYNFREVRWITTGGNVTSAVSRFGTITFTPSAGTYSITGTTSTGAAFVVTNATYRMSAGGFGFLNPPAGEDLFGRLYGLVANGVFIGSSTESGVNNLFVAALQSSTPVTDATFNQPFTLVYTNLADTTSANQIRDAVIPISPNGGGSLGAVTATGFAGSSSTEVTQSISGATYNFSGGVGTLNLGGSGELISGNKRLYVANGGQFVFGGSTTGWDMFVGIRTPTSVPDTVFTNLYFQAGMDIDREVGPAFNSYFGAFNVAQSLHKIVGHQRVQTAPDVPYEYTYGDDYTLTNGTYDDFLEFRNYVSNDGAFKIGFGRLRYLGINVSLKAPPLTGTGTFLNPNGIVNAGSYSPFTAGISPGELLTIFGTNLAPPGTNLEDSNFPTSLGGVSVTINGGITAPIYRIVTNSDQTQQLAVLVPYNVGAGSIADFVVNNNGSPSNHVTAFVNETSPGFFATPDPNGLGFVAARHSTRPDLGIVTADDPAVPGEYLGIFLTGLGAVSRGPNSPPFVAGEPGPVDPFALVTANIDAAIDGTPITGGDFNFKGIAPILRGAYQINLRVPNDARSDNLYVDLGGPDSLNSQIQIPVRAPGATSSALKRQSRSRPTTPHTSANTRRGSAESAGSPSRGR